MNGNHGLTTKTVETIHQVLARHPEVECALLFGSRAKGNYKPGSDIDLALSGPNLNQQTVNRIDTELDDLFLPYRFSLALLDQIGDPEVIAHINRVGTTFYSKMTAERRAPVF